MFPTCGHVPEFTHSRRRSLGQCTLIVAGILIAPLAISQHNVPLTLAEAEDLALASEPGQQAIRAKAAALKERGVVAGELPDPKLLVGLNNLPIESGRFSTEGMTNAAVGMRQDFPAGKTRSIRARRFELLAAEMNQSADARGRNVLTAARSAWLDLYYWDQAHRRVTVSRPLFDDLATVTRSLYSVGRKSQQDVLRAELELSRLDDRLIDIERQRGRALAVLGQWIGDAAARPLAQNLPSWESVPSLESFQAKLSAHPALQAADALIQARSAGVDLADERGKPGWAVQVAYRYREGFLPSGQPRSDFVSVDVTVDLPFFRKKSVNSALSAALQERSAAKSLREQSLRMMHSQLGAEYTQWQELTRQLTLYETRILAQANANAEASMFAYQSDQGDFADVMRAYIDDLNTRIEHIRLQVERAQSYAVLANLGGFPR